LPTCLAYLSASGKARYRAALIGTSLALIESIRGVGGASFVNCGIRRRDNARFEEEANDRDVSTNTDNASFDNLAALLQLSARRARARARAKASFSRGAA